MRTSTFISRNAAAFCLVVAGVIAIPFRASAQTETVLYNFCSQNLCADGDEAESALLIDAQGNLYGTTFFGGAHRGGEVYRIDPDGVLTVLYSFGTSHGDGSLPVGGVVEDALGNLYGVTSAGGTCGGGTVFRLSASGVATILHCFPYTGSFSPYPEGDLLLDAKGNLYGATSAGGANHQGTVYELTPEGIEITLYTFGSTPLDAAGPNGGLIMDSQGDLYGTSQQGGAYGNGTVFVIKRDGSETILHSFNKTNGTDGDRPVGGLVMDAQGNLYGVTAAGGLHGVGTAFSISPSGTEKILLNFGLGTTAASSPDAKLFMDKQGILYGTTFSGGTYNLGTAFRLQPFSILHTFGGGTDGAIPYSGVVMDADGNLFGTTAGGGPHRGGTVFKIAP